MKCMDRGVAKIIVKTISNQRQWNCLDDASFASLHCRFFTAYQEVGHCVAHNGVLPPPSSRTLRTTLKYSQRD